MTLTAAINPVVPLNLIFPLQRVICPQSRQSAKYRIVTHNFTNDDLTNGKTLVIMGGGGLPCLFFRKTKTLSPVVGYLSTMPFNKVGLGLLNTMTSAQEKYLSSTQGGQKWYSPSR